MITAKLQKRNPINQIKVQNMNIWLNAEAGLNQKVMRLFTDELLEVETFLEFIVECSDYGKSLKTIDVTVRSIYNNEECDYEYVDIEQIREIEQFLKNNLIINFN